jgi:ABC-type glutathione transport system ATPase component
MINTHIYEAEAAVPLNPFPGLRPFEFDESNLYFGRDGQSERMLSKLAARRFVAVVGTSGSGKSSLVRAGLLPALYGGFMSSAGSNWRVALMRPGSDPVGNLARALNAPEVFGSEIAENAALQTVITEATLRRGKLGLVESVQQTRMPANESLLVIVDQFEELFRFARVAEGEQYQNEAAAFVKLLLAAINQREIPI